MEEVYYILVMRINLESNYGVEMHPVFTENGKWLRFSTYESAKSWLQENFALEEHKKFAYQIQKAFINKH